LLRAVSRQLFTEHSAPRRNNPKLLNERLPPVLQFHPFPPFLLAPAIETAVFGARAAEFNQPFPQCFARPEQANAGVAR
jgi:hypothetical protein